MTGLIIGAVLCCAPTSLSGDIVVAFLGAVMLVERMRLVERRWVFG